jgi:multidrug resistance efflux pump
MDNEKIEVRSQEVQEILGTPPGWMTRWGSLLALIVVVIMAWIGFYIKYPDTVESNISVSITDPPKRLVTENRGRVKLVRVENESVVRAGEVLVVFENKAKIEDVLSFEIALLSLQNPTDSALLKFKLPEDYMLGDLKSHLYEFYRRQDDVLQFISNPYDKYSVEQLDKEYRKVQSIIRTDRGRWSNVDRQIDMVEDRLRRERQLSAENLLAEERVERTQENLLSLKRMREGIEASIKNRELELQRIQSEKGGVKAGSKEEMQQALVAMRESFSNIRTELSEWMRKYVISSPINGIVSFNEETINEQQFVEEGKEIGVVVPLEKKDTQGLASLEVSKASRIAPGQKVIVRFFSYPYQEFGAVIGVVKSKSQVPIKGKISVNVAFPDGLLTTFNRRIEPSREMKGMATIIMEDKRFLERVFENIRGAVTQEG